MGQIKVELLRGLAGQTERQRASAKGLGLTKRHQIVIIEDTPANRGMINKVSHLVRVDKVED